MLFRGETKNQYWCVYLILKIQEQTWSFLIYDESQLYPNGRGLEDKFDFVTDCNLFMAF